MEGGSADRILCVRHEDMGNMLFSVFLHKIIYESFAFAILDIQIDVRQVACIVIETLKE